LVVGVVIEWLDDFYGDESLRSDLMDAFLPAFSGYVSEAVGPVAGPFVQALAEAYVQHHLDSSRIQLQEVLKGADDPLQALSERFAECEEKRPTKVARNELVRSANAAQVEQMRSRGVTRKVWVASGGSCPYCTGLDGRVVGIEETFFTEGDEYSPEGAESPMTFSSSIGHPPVHQGCDCSIAESFETSVVPQDELTQEERNQEVWFVADVEFDGIPAGQPHPDVEPSGYGLKRGAAEREAQIRARDWGYNKPPELLALEGNMSEARAAWQFGWQDSSTAPYSSLAQRILSEERGISGAIWSNGQPVFEPSDAMRGLVDDIYQNTQQRLTEDSYKLYRGVKTEDAAGNVLESWTTDPAIARRFDGYAVYEAEVPKDRIFMDLSNDPDYGSEEEMIVMGGGDLLLRVFELGQGG
jgi:hypothetical protein